MTLTPSNDPQLYAEHEARAEASERRREREARLCPVEKECESDDWLERLAASKVGRFAAELIDSRNYYLARAKGETFWHDTQEVRQLSQRAADSMGAVIGEVVNAQQAHEAKAEEIKRGAKQ